MRTQQGLTEAVQRHASLQVAAPTDYLGSPITLGCSIVYPTRKGSEMWLSRGVVRSFGKDVLQVEARTSGQKRRTVYIPACRCVVLGSIDQRSTACV